jgi:hypothetical protein
MLGGYIAELHVPLDGSVPLEIDNGPHGHCTIWAGVSAVRALIVSVTRY